MNLNRLYSLIPTALATLTLASCSTPSDGPSDLDGVSLLQAEICRPSYVRLSSDLIEVKEGPWTFTVDFMVVGCAVDLGTLTALEKSDAATVLTKVVRSENLHLIRTAESEALRIQAAAAINELLGREVATDIFIDLVAAGESM